MDFAASESAAIATACRSGGFIARGVAICTCQYGFTTYETNEGEQISSLFARRSRARARHSKSIPASSESLARSLLRLHRLHFAIARRARGGHGIEEAARRLGDVVDGLVEGRFIGLRRARKAAQLAHELQCGSADLVIRRRRLEIEQRANVSAHEPAPWGLQAAARRAFIACAAIA